MRRREDGAPRYLCLLGCLDVHEEKRGDVGEFDRRTGSGGSAASAVRVESPRRSGRMLPLQQQEESGSKVEGEGEEEEQAMPACYPILAI